MKSNNEALRLKDIRHQAILRRHFAGVPLFNAINSLADTIEEAHQEVDGEGVQLALHHAHQMVDGFLNTGIPPASLSNHILS